MAKKKVYVCFDSEKDKHCKFVIESWPPHPDFEFIFNGMSAQQINTGKTPVIKAALAKKLKPATHVLVLVGETINKRHACAKRIGYKNWFNFEIAKSKETKKRLVAVKLPQAKMIPDELRDSRAVWIEHFDWETIQDALSKA